MAEIVLGLASPHAFGGATTKNREALLEKDQTDRRFDYGSLLSKAPSWIEDAVADDKMQARSDAALAGVAELSRILRETAPDVLVVVGDDQYEQFQDANMPMFSVFRGATLPTAKRARGVKAGSQSISSPLWNQMREENAAASTLPPTQPAAPELAEQMIKTLVSDGFDIACSNEMNADVGLGHAFTFVYNRLLPEGGIPLLPVMVNTFFPPNQPTPKRCFALGEALRQAIAEWDSNKRVAVLASGGLSHVIIDEGIDQMLLEGVLSDDRKQLSTLPVDRLNLGTSEIRNWVIVAGAMQGKKSTSVLDYMPMYRTPAGTGNGCSIVSWT
jgi:3-O-methylgallate 3,4-dioxygenase